MVLKSENIRLKQILPLYRTKIHILEKKNLIYVEAGNYSWNKVAKNNISQ